MSIDIDIIPEISEMLINVHKIKSLIDNEMIFDDIDICFKKYGSCNFMDENDFFVLNEYYQVCGIGENTLIIAFEETDRDDKDYEIEIIEDFGRNLSKKSIKTLAELWEESGYTINVTSYAARAKNELEFMKGILVVFTKAVNGKIILKLDGIMSLSVGVYALSEFEKSNFIKNN